MRIVNWDQKLHVLSHAYIQVFMNVSWQQLINNRRFATSTVEKVLSISANSAEKTDFQSPSL